MDLATWIRQDQADAPNYARHTVLVFVDRLDLAVLRGLRYASSLRPTEVRAVHIMVDNEAADQLRRDWIARGLGDRFPLQIVECSDRRLVRAAAERTLDTVLSDRAEVTVLLPRRTYRRLWARLLHDRTADRIATAVGRIPHVAATIVPFDTTLPHEAVVRIEQRQQELRDRPALTRTDQEDEAEPESMPGAQRPAVRPAADGTVPIGSVSRGQKVTVEGQIKLVEVGTTAGKSLEAHLFDKSGGLRLLFFGRTSIPGIEPGALIRATGPVGQFKGHLALANPRYELIAAPTRR